jgi:hypothetical protein
MTQFHNFAKAIQQRFEQLSQHELFVTNQDKDRLYQVYLDAFPAGTNPIFRERTEHDCSCCRQFLKNLANVVAIVDGKVETLWDFHVDFEYPYDVVANELREFTLDHPISSLFRTKERKYGAESNIEQLTDGSTIEWKHFHGTIAAKHFHAEPQQPVGDYNTNVAMLIRLATELQVSAFDDVLGMIEANTLYKGQEFERSVRNARALVVAYNAADDKSVYAWANASNPACRFRNSAIGTLVTELSDGMDLETAVGRYEKMVAPTNYKRPTALITPRMIEDALKTVDELGLRDSLDRRFAVLSDVSVNNVIWVDNSVASKMKDGLATALLDAAVVDNGYDPKKVELITIHDFMAHVVPNVSSIKALVRNVQQGNLMSLTTAAHPGDDALLFKWNNDFAWSYNGNLTDSIKEKVKRAGGNTSDDVKLRISLGWFNSDDLDIHVYEPNGTHIYFGNKAGKQDVDMNAGYHNNAVDPVENVSYVAPQDGVYRIAVNQFSRRSSNNPGFVLELECNGALQQFSYAKPVKDTVVCGTIEYRNGQLVNVNFTGDLVGGSASQDVWGLKTETFVKVNSLMFSPNHWDGQSIGNKHWFFMLDGAHNDQPTRGIYNEYLKADLDKHRKVFEVLGDKTKCPPTADQLSGLGFSSTKGDSLIVQVAGAKLRKTYQINF